MGRRSEWGWLRVVPPVLVAATIGAGTIGALTGAVGLPRGRSLVVAAGDNRTARPPAVAPRGFSITGEAGRLHPGVARRLRLTIRDLEPFPIVVTSISTTVRARRAGCAAGLLTVSPFVGAQVVPAGQSRTVLVTARLAVTAPDACHGAEFALHFNGTGRKKTKKT